VIEYLKVDVFVAEFVTRRWAERFMKQTAIARSTVERAELRSSRGSACLALSSGTFAVSLLSLDRLRRAPGVSVLGAAHSYASSM